MAGKYADLAKTYPAALPKDGAFQANVEALKKKVKKRKPADLAALYDRLRKEKDVLDAQVSEHNVKVAAAEQLLWAAYEQAGIESLALTDGRKIGVTDDISVSIEDREQLHAWIRTNKLESLMTVYSKTVESLTKQRLLAGQPAPDGVKLGSFKKTSYTK